MHRWLTYDRADGSYKTKNHGTLLDADGSNFLSVFIRATVRNIVIYSCRK